MSIVKGILCEHAGVLVQEYLKIWAEYIPNESWTFAYEFSAGSPSDHNILQVRTSVVKDDDTYLTYLMLPDTPVGGSGRGTNPVQYVVSRPGFAASAKNLLSTYGSRNTLDDYETNVHVMRRDLVYYSTDKSAAVDTELDGGGGVVGNVEFRSWAAWYYSNSGPVLVGDQIMVMTSTSNEASPQQTIAQWMQCGIPGGAGGGGAVDLTPVVAALEDISLMDYNISINNGATMFSVNGKARSE